MASIRKRGKQLPAGGVRGLRPGGPPPQAPAKDRPPAGGTHPQSKEKWLEEEAALFERQCKNQPLTVDKSHHPGGVHRILAGPYRSRQAGQVHFGPGQTGHRPVPARPGSYKLTELKPEHFRNLYATLRKQKNSVTGKPLSESTVEGVHACLCGILSDAMEGGFLSQNPAWRTYKYAGKKKKKRNVADEETTKRLIAALEEESINTKPTSNSSSLRGCAVGSAAASNGRTWTSPRSPSTSAATW